jgi:hypothetical protein
MAQINTDCVSPIETGYREPPAFEFESFATLGLNLGEADARRLLAQFLDDGLQRLENMRAMLDDGQIGGVHDSALALNCACAALGLARLASIAGELAEIVATKDFGRIEMLSHAARAAFVDARPFIDEALTAN